MDPDAPQYTLRDQVADAAGLLGALGLARAHVVGFGGGELDRRNMAGVHYSTDYFESSVSVNGSRCRSWRSSCRCTAKRCR